MVEQSFVHTLVWPGLNGPTRALLRSQHGPLASAPFTALPTFRVTRFDAQPFHLLLCRRLHFLLPLTQRTCRCGRQLDMFGHHRAACAEAGVLGKRGFNLAAAQIGREAGARVATNVWVRDMDLGEFNALDGRRLEVVADGSSFWRGAPLAIDTTLVSPLARRVRFNKGRQPRRSCTAEGEKKEGGHVPGAVRRRWSGTPGCMAAEVRGRWSVETAQFLSALAKAKAQSAPHLLQGRVEAAWLRRWSATLACSAARSFAVSLLDRRPVPGTGDAIPSTREVVRDDRFA